MSSQLNTCWNKVLTLRHKRKNLQRVKLLLFNLTFKQNIVNLQRLQFILSFQLQQITILTFVCCFYFLSLTSSFFLALRFFLTFSLLFLFMFLFLFLKQFFLVTFFLSVTVHYSSFYVLLRRISESCARAQNVSFLNSH